MARASLWRGLAFALVVGALAPSLVWELPYGYGMLLAVLLHLALVAASWRDAFRASALAGLLAALCVVFIRDQLLLTAFALVILSLARSAVLYPRPFVRALVAELLVVGLGVGVALIWFGSGALSIALSCWGFWLVQSGFALGVGSAHPVQEQPSDPFERAQRLAEAVLAGRPR